ncbi:MAG: MscS family membrane protein [Halioglobus sp.]|jgi:MscS family membrane protein
MTDWIELVLASKGLVLQLPALLLAGVVGHFLLGFVVRRSQIVALKSERRWDDVLVAAAETPVRAVLWIVVCYLALELIAVADGFRIWFRQAYDTSLVLLLGWFALRLIRGVEGELLREEHGNTDSTDKASVHATAQLLRIILWVLGGLMVLQTLGISISGLLAFGGIGGIAVGFAAKDMLSNFFGGLSIYMDRPFTKGDWIRSPDREIEGTVEDIGWRLTRIRTFSQRPLYVPNAVFSQVALENPSRMLNRQIHETIGLRYQDAGSMAKIVDQVKAMLEEHPEIDLSRTLIVNFVTFGPSSLDFFVYTFTKTTNWVAFHKIKQEIMLTIFDIVKANGADIAFPTQTLHLSQVEPEPQP